MGSISIVINDKKISVADGSTILQAAETANIRIPTLCHIKDIAPGANCRMCVVEVEKSRTFQPACATKVYEGMVVYTDTAAVRKSRKTTLELLLSRHAVDCHHCMRIGSSKCKDLDPIFCEMCFFCDCVRDGFCELQSLAREYGVDVLPYESEPYCNELDDSTGSIIRDPNKCIKCKRCVEICGNVQTVHNLSVMNRGSKVKIVPALAKSMADSPCVQCGRCVDICPTGAIYVQEHKDEVVYFAHKYGVTTAAQISPDILPELARLFKLDEPEADMSRVVAGLRKIGIDYIFDDSYARSIAANTVTKKLEEKLSISDNPIIFTDSYAAKKFTKEYFSDLSENVITYDSAQQAFGSHIKSIFVHDKKLDTKTVRTISITNSNENAAEAQKTGSVDYVLNARELYRIFLRTGVDIKKRPQSEPDSFGIMAENPLEGLVAPVTWQISGSVTELEVEIGGTPVKAAITHNLGQARELLTQIKSGASPYRLVKLNA